MRNNVDVIMSQLLKNHCSLLIIVKTDSTGASYYWLLHKQVGVYIVFNFSYRNYIIVIIIQTMDSKNRTRLDWTLLILTAKSSSYCLYVYFITQPYFICFFIDIIWFFRHALLKSYTLKKYLKLDTFIVWSYYKKKSNV